jgi:hypothetical protein
MTGRLIRITCKVSRYSAELCMSYTCGYDGVVAHRCIGMRLAGLIVPGLQHAACCCTRLCRSAAATEGDHKAEHMHAFDAFDAVAGIFCSGVSTFWV